MAEGTAAVPNGSGPKKEIPGYLKRRQAPAEGAVEEQTKPPEDASAAAGDGFEDAEAPYAAEKRQQEEERQRQEADAAAKAAKAEAKTNAKAEKAAAKAAQKAAKPKGKPGRKKPADGEANAAPRAEDIPAADRTVRKDDNGPDDVEYHRYAGKMAELTTKAAGINGQIRNLKKQMKNDGIDPQLFAEVMKEMKLNTDEIIDRDNAKQRMRRAFLLPAYAPIALETVGTRSEEEILKHATLEGNRAGLRGANSDANPHDQGTKAWQAWAEGYDTGQGALMRALGRGRRGADAGSGA